MEDTLASGHLRSLNHLIYVVLFERVLFSKDSCDPLSGVIGSSDFFFVCWIRTEGMSMSAVM